MVVGDKHTFVGNFFEELGHRVLGGTLERDEHGDICLWRRGATVEVKSSGDKSSYGFRLSINQIEQYEKLRAFPFSKVWYMFFAYDNPSEKGDEGKRSSKLSAHVSREAVQLFLAKSVQWCLLADFSIVKGWRHTRPISSKSVMGHPGAQTVDLKCHHAHTLTNGGLASELRELGLAPDEYGRLSGMIRTSVSVAPFGNLKVKFPLTAVLPYEEISSVQRMMRRRGFALKTGSI
jgi:hypothetical protein